MSLSDNLWSFIAGILIIAILAVLVRPGSAGADAVTDVGSALTTLVRAAVGS